MESVAVRSGRLLHRKITLESSNEKTPSEIQHLRHPIGIIDLNVVHHFRCQHLARPGPDARVFGKMDVGLGLFLDGRISNCLIVVSDRQKNRRPVCGSPLQR